jgi:hypothetical protein
MPSITSNGGTTASSRPFNYGIYCPLVTPFTASGDGVLEGRIDMPALQKQEVRTAEAGMGGGWSLGVVGAAGGGGGGGGVLLLGENGEGESVLPLVYQDVDTDPQPNALTSPFAPFQPHTNPIQSALS